MSGASLKDDAERRMVSRNGKLHSLSDNCCETPQEKLETVCPCDDAQLTQPRQMDDLAMLCPERKETRGDREMLKIEAKNENLDAVNAFVDAFLEAHDCSMKVQMQIDLCVEEVFVNIASYAYGDGSGDAEIDISEANGVVTLTFTDAGTPYDPLAKADPDTTLSAQERQIGGLGIFLVKKTMDAVSYRREDGKNILTMSKRIS